MQLWNRRQADQKDGYPNRTPHQLQRQRYYGRNHQYHNTRQQCRQLIRTSITGLGILLSTLTMIVELNTAVYANTNSIQLLSPSISVPHSTPLSSLSTGIAFVSSLGNDRIHHRTSAGIGNSVANKRRLTDVVNSGVGSLGWISQAVERNAASPSQLYWRGLSNYATTGLKHSLRNNIDKNTPRASDSRHSLLEPSSLSLSTPDALTLGDYDITTPHNSAASKQSNRLDLQLLLIDNYDSYTYNLYSYLCTICKQPPIVVSNDDASSWDKMHSDLELEFGKIGSRGIDGIVISPGPGRPERREDIGICLEAIEKNPNLPILGVCLGHQALGYYYNATVTLAPWGPVHGLLSKMCYTDDNTPTIDDRDSSERNGRSVLKCNLFDGIPQFSDVVRYHSLTVQFPPPSQSLSTLKSSVDSNVGVEPIAWCRGNALLDVDDDGNLSSPSWPDGKIEMNADTSSCVMALRHKVNPHYGVQFHPESVGTGEVGYRLLANFCSFCLDWRELGKDHISNAGMTSNSGGGAVDDSVTSKSSEGNGNINHQERKIVSNGNTSQHSVRIEYPGRNRVQPSNREEFSDEHDRGYSASSRGGSKDTRAYLNDDVAEDKNPSPNAYNVLVHKMDFSSLTSPLPPTPEKVFECIFSSMDTSFWLDSSTGKMNRDFDEILPTARNNTKTDCVEDSSQSCPIISNSRFSIMGGDDGPLFQKMEYFGRDHKIERQGLYVSRAAAGLEINKKGRGDKSKRVGQMMEVDEVGGDILSYLRQEVSHGRKDPTIRSIVDLNSSINNYTDAVDPNSAPSLPFDYIGGYVGYLGYEVRHDTRVTAVRSNDIRGEQCKVMGMEINEGVTDDGKTRRQWSDPNVPTAAFVFADRSLIYDHWKGDWYILGIATDPDSNADPTTTAHSDSDIIDWMRNIADEIRIAAIPTSHKEVTNPNSLHNPVEQAVNFKLHRCKDQYTADIAQCHNEIRNGESYELCLTNRVDAQVTFPAQIGDNDSENNSEKEDMLKSPFGLYKILRRKNPAPFAAFMKFGPAFTSSTPRQETRDEFDKACQQGGLASVSICCSSPERFLSIKGEEKGINTSISNSDIEEEQSFPKLNHGWSFTPPSNSYASSITDGTFSSVTDVKVPVPNMMIIESKPIKGTSSRILNDNWRDSKVADLLRSSVKDRAENLMIVDLLRNDLSQVCVPGSVHVPRLMHIESFATVHQLVSTIRGTLDMSKSNAVDAIASCFPGGSMTGAPKIRSVDILDKMEMSSRGPYSGCLGYISLNGCADMNILIRSAVVTPSVESIKVDNDVGAGGGSSGKVSWNVSIGAGGAITALSDSDDEFDEMMLKARAVKESVQEWCFGKGAGNE